MKSIQGNTMMRWWLAIMTSLLFTACGGGDDDNGNDVVTAANTTWPNNAFTATLTGGQAVPANASGAVASGVVIVDQGTQVMKATVVTAAIAGITVQIREVQPIGVDNIVFGLVETSLGSAIWITETVLNSAQLNALNAGRYYFVVISAAFPDGELRGPILRPPPQTSPAVFGFGNGDTTPATSFTNVLTGSQQVPATASGATAIGITMIDHIAGTLAAAVTTTGITGTQANIREAPPGINGRVIFPLTQTSPASGVWITRLPVSNMQIDSLLAGNDYFEVASAAFPAGEIRGQITHLNGKPWFHDCRFGTFGFGFPTCGVDGFVFIGFGFSDFRSGAFIDDGFADDFNGGFLGIGFGDSDGGFSGFGGFNSSGASTPAPGIIF